MNRPTQSEAIDKIAAALSKAQAEIATARKDGDNPHFHSTFTTLASVFDVVREPLAKNNLSVVQSPQQGDANAHYLETTLMHSSGQWMKSYHPLHPVKNDPQSVGSAITYARRYALCAMVGVVGREDDDDGETAQGRGNSQAAQASKPAPTKPASAPAASKPAAPAKPAAPPAKPTAPLGYDAIANQMREAATMDDLKAAGEKAVNEPKATQDKLRPIYMEARKRISEAKPAAPAQEPQGDEVAV